MELIAFVVLCVHFIVCKSASTGSQAERNGNVSTNNIETPTTDAFDTDVLQTTALSSPTQTATETLMQAEANSQPTEKELLEYLFKDYNSNARPVRNVSDTISVTVSLLLVSIDNLNERDQILTSYAWFNMEWIDEFLTWNPADWAGIDMLVVPGHMVWSPDVVIRNSAKSLRGDILDEDKIYRYILMSYGRIKLWTAGSISTSCQVDMTFFPFDDQVCHIGIDSWIYPMNKLYMRNGSDEIDLNLYRESGQWHLLKTDVRFQIDKYVQPDGIFKYTVLSFNLYFRRKPMYYVYNIVVPSVILSLLVLLMFLLPADSGEKVSLGITVLLSFTVFQLVIADNLPKTSDNVSIIVIYIVCTMVFASISLVCTVGILAMHYQDPETPVPAWLHYVSLMLSRPFRLTAPSEKNSTEDPHNFMEHNATEDAHKAPFQAKFNSQRSPGLHNHGFEGEDIALGTTSTCEGGSTVGPKCSDQEKLHPEWRFVARVVDLSLFVFFLCATVVTAVVLLGIYPSWKPAIRTLAD